MIKNMLAILCMQFFIWGATEGFSLGVASYVQGDARMQQAVSSAMDLAQDNVIQPIQLAQALASEDIAIQMEAVLRDGLAEMSGQKDTPYKPVIHQDTAIPLPGPGYPWKDRSELMIFLLGNGSRGNMDIFLDTYQALLWVSTIDVIFDQSLPDIAGDRKDYAPGSDALKNADLSLKYGPDNQTLLSLALENDKFDIAREILSLYNKRGITFTPEEKKLREKVRNYIRNTDTHALVFGPIVFWLQVGAMLLYFAMAIVAILIYGSWALSPAVFSVLLSIVISEAYLQFRWFNYYNKKAEVFKDIKAFLSYAEMLVVINRNKHVEILEMEDMGGGTRHEVTDFVFPTDTTAAIWRIMPWVLCGAWVVFLGMPFLVFGGLSVSGLLILEGVVFGLFVALWIYSLFVQKGLNEGLMAKEITRLSDIPMQDDGLMFRESALLSGIATMGDTVATVVAFLKSDAVGSGVDATQAKNAVNRLFDRESDASEHIVKALRVYRDQKGRGMPWLDTVLTQAEQSGDPHRVMKQFFDDIIQEFATPDRNVGAPLSINMGEASTPPLFVPTDDLVATVEYLKTQA